MAEETKKKPGGNKNSGKQPYLYTNSNFKKVSKTAKTKKTRENLGFFGWHFLSTRVEMLDKKDTNSEIITSIPFGKKMWLLIIIRI